MEKEELFKLPSWKAKPPHGTHLDVTKNDNLIQKLLIDEKPAYYFGRSLDSDFVIEHASASRFHAVLVYHGLLKKFALVDLKSTHGTYVRGTRITSLQPVFVELNDDFYFGASTRKYIIRSKPDSAAESSTLSKEDVNLPEKEQELDSLTTYNTMNNRRIAPIPITVEEARRKSRPRNNVVFLEEEDIINPEDVDPSVGRFRNLIQTAVVGKRKAGQSASDVGKNTKRRILLPGKDASSSGTYSSLLGISSISAAPSLDLYSNISPAIGPIPMPTPNVSSVEDDSFKKKKYAKEAWPGRKPTHSVI